MLHEVSRLSETLPTGRAAVGFLPGVCSLVFIKRGGIREVFLAGPTGVGLLSRVDP